LIRARAGDIPESRVRRVTLRSVVDSGATRLVIPKSVADCLGAEPTGEVGVCYADGRVGQRPMVRGVHLTWGGRSSVFNAIVEPDRDSALLGAIVLEDLDLVIDCTTQTLRPRDPNRIISEIE
jgi:predicted aspartyl protease